MRVLPTALLFHLSSFVLVKASIFDFDANTTQKLRDTDALLFLFAKTNNTNKADAQSRLMEANGTALAHVQLFLPLTGGSGTDDLFAALLALHAWTSQAVNDACPRVSIVNSQREAPVIDTKLSPVVATQELISILSNQQDELPIAGILGGFRSAVTSPMAILSGLPSNSIPQISHASTSLNLDVREQFPLFGRTVPSAEAEAQASVDFLLQVANTTHFVILFTPDSFGSSLEKALAQKALDKNITTQSFAVPLETDDPARLTGIMDRVHKTNIKHVVAICSETQLISWLRAADEALALGDDSFWIFIGLDINGLLRLPDVPSSLLSGSAIVQMQGGVTTNTLYFGSSDELTVEEASPKDPARGFAKFLSLWNEASNDVDFVSYFKDLLPPERRNTKVLSSQPGGVRPFMFDAMIGMLNAICTASKQSGAGTEIYDAFRNAEPFEGASGMMRINPETCSREIDSIEIVYFNPQAVNLGDKDVLGLVPSMYYTNGQVVLVTDESKFVFRNNSDLPPASLAPAEIEKNYIGQFARATGFVLASILIVAALIASLFVYLKRDNVTTKRSNSLFLLTICLGCAIMSSTTYLIGVDEVITESTSALDMSCKAAPFLYATGVSLLVGALLAKTTGLYQAFKDSELQHLPFSNSRLLLHIGAMLSLNMIVCILWAATYPLVWSRSFSDSQDQFGRYTSSIGLCSGKNSGTFYMVLILINAIAVLCGCVYNFWSRLIETADSGSVSISLAILLQAWCVGVPIIIAVWDSPSGRFVVESIVVFLSGSGVLVAIFIPLLQQRMRETPDEGVVKETEPATSPNGARQEEAQSDDSPNR